MEGNKDEALRCLDIARRHYSEGNLPQALKFVQKSLNLYPTDTARDLFTIYENKAKDTQHTQNSHQSSHNESHTTHRGQPHQNSTHHNKTHASASHTGNAGNPSPGTERAYTHEQHQAVQRVIKLKDYYEILEISKDASEADIKRAYRKLALVMHPDKNAAPGAEEAFKSVSKAFACLSDPHARKRYDLHGHEAPSVPSHHHRHPSNFSFESELTPEEIFEMMFGGGRAGGFRTYSYTYGGGARAPRRGAQHHHQQTESDSIASLLIQFLPLLLIGFLIFFFSTGPEEPLFSLQKTSSYIVPRETHNWGVEYYVKYDTPQKLAKKSINLESLEKDVERYWKADTERKCHYEQQQYRKMERALNFASPAEKELLKEKIRNYKMEHCEALQRTTKAR